MTSITKSREIFLKIALDIDGNRIILLINHWKSKRGPESMRIA